MSVETRYKVQQMWTIGTLKMSLQVSRESKRGFTQEYEDDVLF